MDVDGVAYAFHRPAMVKLNRKQIQAKALELLAAAPEGIRYRKLVRAIHETAPETPINSVDGAVHHLRVSSDKIYIPSKGLWTLKPDSYEPIEKSSIDEGLAVTTPAIAGKIVEEDFYASLAQWLRDDEEEVTEAVPLGGSILKDKWGTPDVIGILKPKAGDFVTFPIEIVAIEIKIDVSQSVTAFGQTCAYRLFAHRVYLAMPDTIGAVERDKLESLCLLFGIGLIFFKLNKLEPDYRQEVRASRHTPDMFFSNQFAKRLQSSCPKAFHKLF
jgi:hypothetical protein